MLIGRAANHGARRRAEGLEGLGSDLEVALSSELPHTDATVLALAPLVASRGVATVVVGRATEGSHGGDEAKEESDQHSGLHGWVRAGRRLEIG